MTKQKKYEYYIEKKKLINVSDAIILYVLTIPHICISFYWAYTIPQEMYLFGIYAIMSLIGVVFYIFSTVLDTETIKSPVKRRVISG